MPKEFDHEVAGVMLIDKRGNIVAQLRDDKPTINDPGKVGFFGGGMEAGETPLQGALRELDEETNLGLTADDVQPFMTYIMDETSAGPGKYRVHIFIATGIDPTTMEVYEGQRAYILDNPTDPLLADAVRLPVAKWFKMRK
jgi:8-oxo-dGTP diphosphatase